MCLRTTTHSLYVLWHSLCAVILCVPSHHYTQLLCCDTLFLHNAVYSLCAVAQHMSVILCVPSHHYTQLLCCDTLFLHNAVYSFCAAILCSFTTHSLCAVAQPMCCDTLCSFTPLYTAYALWYIFCAVILCVPSQRGIQLMRCGTAYVL